LYIIFKIANLGYDRQLGEKGGKDLSIMKHTIKPIKNSLIDQVSSILQHYSLLWNFFVDVVVYYRIAKTL
jgi:hypothetical protein